MNCPECKRRPSERWGPYGDEVPCTDPIHDLADVAPEMLRTLQDIASFADKTLLGDGRYDEGANAAFEQCAGLARVAFDKATGQEVTP